MAGISTGKKRAVYLAAAVVLLGIEFFIALFVHDRFVRPYVGDMLVVIVIYMFVRIFVSEKIKLLPLYLFLFATAVEVLQYFRIAALLGLENNRVLSVLIGATFDWKDIVCYAAGCLLLGVYEAVRAKKRLPRQGA